jgi:hypothetical protein
VAPVGQALLYLDQATVARLRPVLAWFGERGGLDAAGPRLLEDFLSQELPRRWPGDEHERHEVAWALGDLLERAGLPELAARCRSASTHEWLAVWDWVRSFSGVREEFWSPAVAALGRPAVVPPRVALSLSSAQALLETVGDGVTLTPAGHLPMDTVLALDDRFRWTDEFPWMRATDEAAIAPLRFLREHLVAQRLLQRRGDRLVPSARGVACTRDTARLWRAVVDPSPRWSGEFERDALGVMAASVLRSEDFTLGRIAEEMTGVLAGKWRPAQPARPANVYDGASPVAQAWYQLGVPLGWWDTGRGPADRRPNPFGRAAAVAVLRAVAGPAVRG